MGTHDHDDKQIRDIFREAREQEETSIPPFDDVMGHESSTAKPSWFARIWTGPGLKLAMGSVATVLIVAWAASVFTEQNRVDMGTPEGEALIGVPEVELAKPDLPETAPPESIVVEKYTPSPVPAEPEPVERREMKAQNMERELFLGDPGVAHKRTKTGLQDADGDGNPNIHGSRSRDVKTIIFKKYSPPPESVIERRGDFNTESYAPISENDFKGVLDHPLSTFSIDVDTASYSNVRRYLNSGNMPPPDAVRIEELLNYFTYNDPAPRGSDPFSVNVEIADAPWNTRHRLARIGLQGREIRRGELEGCNLVFLLDVSGSMNTPNKLPLLKKAMGLLVDQLGRNDTVSIVVYAGASGLVLEPTSGNDKASIREALERLSAGGGTNGGAGLRLAYDMAKRSFLRGGVNRVILATDGDFNLGTTGKGELLDLIERYAKQDNISLTALGFGMGNYKDDMLEHLADKANGNYAYIDSLAEARKVLVEQVGGTLVTIAKDVKIQVEFNPAEVAAYRLIGYENRLLAKEDFNDDTKDAGEIGAGHSVTALYEIVPAGLEYGADGSGVDPLKYQKDRAELKPGRAAGSGELFTVKLRYKEPEGSTSKLIEVPVTDSGSGLRAASGDFRFASAVAAFGMKLRHSEHVADMGWNEIRNLAESGRDDDPGRYRAEFIELLGRVR